MEFSFTTQPAIFLERPNRYVVHAQLHDSDEVVRAHCPDPGRLEEMLIPGVTVHVDRAGDASRRTSHTLRFVEHPESGQLVSLNTQLPNALFREGLHNGFFPQFADCTQIEREVRLSAHVDALGDGGVTSRIDFRLTNAAGDACWVEVKSASLVLDGVARFPDAPTVRGRRHVEELTMRRSRGDRAAVVFIVQRPDAQRFEPFWERDPAFAETLQQAAQRGVEIYAYTCDLTTKAIWLEREIPVCVKREM